jgi:hypothetical protein
MARERGTTRFILLYLIRGSRSFIVGLYSARFEPLENPTSQEPLYVTDFCDSRITMQLLPHFTIYSQPLPTFPFSLLRQARKLNIPPQSSLTTCVWLGGRRECLQPGLMLKILDCEVGGAYLLQEIKGKAE